MTGKDDGAREAALSPAEIEAECDRDLEEQRRELSEALDRKFYEGVRRSIKRSVHERVFSVMD